LSLRINDIVDDHIGVAVALVFAKLSIDSLPTALLDLSAVSTQLIEDCLEGVTVLHPSEVEETLEIVVEDPHNCSSNGYQG
jgi:hypothetical protein